MSGGFAAFPFRIALRLLRKRKAWASVLPLAFACWIITAMAVVFTGLTLSPAQVADRDVGIHDYSAGFGIATIKPGDDEAAVILGSATQSSGASHVMTSLVTLMAGQFPGQRGESQVRLREAVWTDKPFPTRYELTDGRWPRSAGEAVVLNDQTVETGRISLLSNQIQLTVVGHAIDKYANAKELLTAPGTWKTFPPDAMKEFPGFTATPVVYWSGSEPDVVLQAMAESLSANPELLDRELRTAKTDDLVYYLSTSLLSRREAEADSPKYALTDLPILYGVPSLVLPGLGVCLMVAVEGQWRRRMVALLAKVGLSGSAVAQTTWWYFVIRAGFAVLLGTILGYPTGVFVTRAAVRVTGSPEGTYPLPWPTLVLLLVVAVVVCTVAIWSLSREPKMTSRSWEARRTDARHLIAVAFLCASLYWTTRITDVGNAFLLMVFVSGGVLMMLPEIVSRILRLIPRQGRQSNLAFRQLLRYQGRATAAVALVTVVTATAFGFLTVFDSIARTASGQLSSPVARGQILLDRPDEAFRLPSKKVLDAVSHALGGDTGKIIWSLSGTREGHVSLAGDLKPIAIVQSTNELESLTQMSLSDDQSATLSDGGVLLWEGVAFPPGRAPDFVQLSDSKVAIGAETLTLPPYQWRQGSSGVVLSTTAEERGWDSTPESWIYVDVNAAQVDAALDSVSDRGLDTEMVTTYREPDPAIPPVELRVSAVLLTLMMAGVLLFIIKAQTDSLRVYLQTLSRIGLPPSWIRGVMIRQLACIFTMGLTLGFFMSGIPLLALRTLAPSIMVAIPWQEVLTILGSVAVTIALVSWVSLRRLQPAKALEW